MNIVDNWFNNYEVAEIFAKERNCKLISNSLTSNNKIMFLEYKFIKAINYLPVNAYSSIEISNNSGSSSKSLSMRKIRSPFE